MKYVAERVEIVKIITDMVKWRVEMTESFGREGIDGRNLCQKEFKSNE